MVGAKPKNECIVDHHIFKAATPVGARIAIFLLLFSKKYINNVDFHVPALPVKKIFLLLFSIKSSAFSAISSNCNFFINFFLYKI
jgi:hypothetical protein